MVHQRQCEKVARIFNVSQEFVFQHLTAEGRFNMLKAGVDYLLEYQERLVGRVGTGFVDAMWLDVDVAVANLQKLLCFLQLLLVSSLFAGTTQKLM